MEDIARYLAAHAEDDASGIALRFAFAHACAERVRHLLEDPGVIACLDILAAYCQGRVDEARREEAEQAAAALANRHPGSRSLDGAGHAAVSASYTVAQALAGRAVQAAEYSAYAAVYGNGGYGAVSDPEAFAGERVWQLEKLQELSGTARTR